MHRRDDDVLHTRVFNRLHPLVRIKLSRVERLHHLLQILLPFDFHNPLQMLRISLHLLAVPLPAEGRIDTPMNEHSKLRLPPPGQPGILVGVLSGGDQFGRCVGVGLGQHAYIWQESQDCSQTENQPHGNLIIDQLSRGCRVLI